MAAPSEALSLKGVRDAAIYALDTDEIGTLTYGTGFAITIQEYNWTPDINTVKLPGNDVTLDIVTHTKGHTGTIKGAKVHKSFIAVLTGAKMSTTANSRMIEYTGEDVPGYFKTDIKCAYTGPDGGCEVLKRYKCKFTNLTYQLTQDDYVEFSCDWECIPTTYKNAAGKTLIGSDVTYATDVNLLS